MSLYHCMLKALYPPGVYTDHPGSIHDQLVQTDARGLELGQSWVSQLEDEIWPERAVATLADWEALFQISPQAEVSLKQRQATVASSFRHALSSSPEHIRMMVADLLNATTAFHDRHDDSDVSFRWERRYRSGRVKESGSHLILSLYGEMAEHWTPEQQRPVLCLLPLVDRDDDVVFEGQLTAVTSAAVSGGMCFFESVQNALCLGCQKIADTETLEVTSWRMQNGALLQTASAPAPALPFWLRMRRIDGRYRFEYGQTREAFTLLSTLKVEQTPIKPRLVGYWAAQNRQSAQLGGQLRIGETLMRYQKPWNNVELIELPLACVPENSPEFKYFAYIHREPQDTGPYYLEACQRLLDRVKPAHTLIFVGQSDCARCDDPYSLCDRDILGS